MTPSNNPTLLAGRYMKALALSDGKHDVARAFIAGQSWPEAFELTKELDKLVSKSAVSAGQLTDLTPGPVGYSFLAALRPVSILGRLGIARRVPLRVRVIAFNAGTRAFLGVEGLATPLSADSLTGVIVQPRRSAGLSVVTSDTLTRAAPGTEDALTADLAAAVGASEDLAFFSPTVATSVLYGTTPIASSGSSLSAIDTDLQALLATVIASGSSLAALSWVMGQTTAMHLSFLRGSGGTLAYPGVSATGGTLLGLPVIVSATVSGYIGVIDEAGLLIGDGAVRIDIARSATIEMSDTPNNSSVTPVATQQVSMFQTDSVAIRGECFRGWYARTGAAAYISGVSF